MISLTKMKMALVLCLAGVMALIGCSHIDPSTGYTSKSLYRCDIKTVCVEMFRSQSFRRGIEFELTRALVGQLELHSPYKVVSDRSKADTVLYGTINGVSERVLHQQRELDRPLENQMVLTVDVTWKDLRSGKMLLDNQRLAVTGDYVVLLGGGSRSAIRQASNEMAVRIVEAMETPW